MLLPHEQRDRILGGPENRAKVDAYIADLVAESPPLTAAQRARLRVLVRPARAADVVVSSSLKTAA